MGKIQKLKFRIESNGPFLGLVAGTALGNGPNSDDAMEHDTQRKRVGQFEIAVLTSKFIALNVQCRVSLPIYSFLKTVSALNQLPTQDPFRELDNFKTKSFHGERDVQKPGFYNPTREAVLSRCGVYSVSIRKEIKTLKT